tara:strand:+ start:10453 stop:10881 length:429 start_codon:yes stop_codon:yes gene_type:complete
MKLNRDSKVADKFASYPEEVKPHMEYLRLLVLETAKELGIEELEETLKWGEPSYLTKKGSTLRMDWKAKNPNQYALYFKCTSKLVPSFKAVFGDVFEYQKNRAILFQINQEIPIQEVKQCIAATLQYHKVKDQENLNLATNE